MKRRQREIFHLLVYSPNSHNWPGLGQAEAEGPGLHPGLAHEQHLLLLFLETLAGKVEQVGHELTLSRHLRGSLTHCAPDILCVCHVCQASMSQQG